MIEEKNINDILKDFIDRYQHAKPLRAVVDEVEGGFIFASPSDGSAIVKAFYNINLVPKVGSVVFITMLDADLGFISQYGDIDAAVIVGDQFGGVPKVAEVVQKLNALENDLNTLKQVFSSFVPVPSDGGAALKAAAATWAGQTLVNTQVTELENENVKHG